MIRGLYHDNYCGFAGEPPPTAKPDFPLGTLTFSEKNPPFWLPKERMEVRWMNFLKLGPKT